MDTTFANGMREYVNILSPWFLIIGTLIGIIYGLWTKSLNDRLKAMENTLITEKKERIETAREMQLFLDRREDAANKHCENCKEKLLNAVKEANRDMIDNFQEGIRIERDFRLGIMHEQKINIDRLFERIDAMAIMIEKIKTTQEIYIKLDEQDK